MLPVTTLVFPNAWKVQGASAGEIPSVGRRLSRQKAIERRKSEVLKIKRSLNYRLPRASPRQTRLQSDHQAVPAAFVCLLVAAVPFRDHSLWNYAVLVPVSRSHAVPLCEPHLLQYQPGLLTVVPG